MLNCFSNKSRGYFHDIKGSLPRSSYLTIWKAFVLAQVDKPYPSFHPSMLTYNQINIPGGANMHELFLTSHIANDDLSRTLRILQGYCGMKPVSLLERRLMWEGPRARTNLKGIDTSFVMRQPPHLVPVWRGLHEQLVRQSYILTVIYDVTRDFAQAEANGSEEKP